MSAAAFLELLGGGGRPEAGATPGTAGTPAAGSDQGGEDQQLPLAIYQMRFAGGTLVLPGQTDQVVLDLTAGEWVAWGDDPSAPQQPVTVTGDFPADVKDPQADLTATLVDFAISFAGDLIAGTHVLKVQHHGAQPHFLELDKGPDTMTTAQVQTALAGELSGATPARGGLGEHDL